MLQKIGPFRDTSKPHKVDKYLKTLKDKLDNFYLFLTS